MQRLPVESSDIVSIGYDPKERILEIEFKEDRIYQYADVAPDVYERFVRADSYGEFFFAHITKHYRYKRIKVEKQQAPAAVAFVTTNKVKLDDMRRACEPFGIEVEQLDIPLDEIQSHDTEKIAVNKAKQAYKIAKRPVVIMDAYWNILSLRGFPGAYMSYMNDWLKPEDFLALMKDKKDRTVGIIETLVYYDGKRSKVLTKDWWGTIIDEPRGKSKLPFRTLVVLAGHDKTLAELEGDPDAARTDPADTIWGYFAKWYNLQRRIAGLK